MNIVYQPRILIGLLLFSIALLTFAIYQQTTTHQFVHWDTHKYILENPHIKAFSWENIQWMFTSFYMANWHPLTWLSHALDYAMFGLQPGGHHFTSVLLHIFNVLLFFWVSYLLLTKVWPPGQSPYKMPVTAALAALIFAIHPQHVESVAWVAERKDVLFLFFTLLSLIAYFFYTDSQKKYYYVLSIISFGLALMAKPMAVTLPVVLLLLDVYPLKRTPLLTSNQSRSWITIGLEKLPFLLLSFMMVIITILAQAHGQAFSSSTHIDFGLRIFNAIHSFIFYLSKLVFPINLSPFYPFPTEENRYFTYLSAVMGFSLISLLTVYLWTKKQYFWLISWLFYLITLSPVIGIIQVGSQAAADRYTYWPSLVFHLLMAIAWVQAYQYLKQRRQVFSVLWFILGLVYGGWLVNLTINQVGIWKNDFTLWHHAALVTPNSSRAHINLASQYQKQRQYQYALRHYQQALAIKPHPDVFLGLALTYLNLQQLDKALAVYQHLNENWQLYPADQKIVWHNMAWIYARKQAWQQAKQAVEKALLIVPEDKTLQDLLQYINENRREK